MGGVETKERVLYLDFLKILAAFLVVFYHFAYSKLDYGFAYDSIYFPNINRIVMCFASCSVPIFFIVNGILMFSKERSLKDVYYKAGKILVLTVIWSLIGFPSWFFKTLFVLYLLFPLFQYLWNMRRGIYYALIILLLVMPFSYNLIILILKSIGIKSIGAVVVARLNVTGLKTMYSVVYFLIGNVLVKKELGLIKSIGVSIFGWSLVVAECTVYTNLNHSVYDGVNAAFPTIGALLLAIGAFFIAKKVSFARVRCILFFLSRGVLSVYLMHTFVMAVRTTLFGKIEQIGLLSAIVYSVLVYLVCLGIGEALKRIPVVCCLVKL